MHGRLPRSARRLVSDVRQVEVRGRLGWRRFPKLVSCSLLFSSSQSVYMVSCRVLSNGIQLL